MECRLIQSPSSGTLEILRQRTSNATELDWQQIGAIGLIQGRMIEMIFAADIAEKAAGVVVQDIRGNCPQNMILLALYGDTASVQTAIAAVQNSVQEKLP